MSNTTVACVMLPVLSRVTRMVIVENPLKPGALIGGTSLSGDIAALKTVVSCVSAQTAGDRTSRNNRTAQSFLIDFLAWTEFWSLVDLLSGGWRNKSIPAVFRCKSYLFVMAYFGGLLSYVDSFVEESITYETLASLDGLDGGSDLPSHPDAVG